MNEVQTVILVLIIFTLFILCVWLYLKNDIDKAKLEYLETMNDSYKTQNKELKENLNKPVYIHVKPIDDFYITSSDKFKAKVKSALREIENEKRQQRI